MTHIIEQKIRAGLVSQSSGVYKMLGEGGKVLYVGKAKNLVNRLKSYLQYAEVGEDGVGVPLPLQNCNEVGVPSPLGEGGEKIFKNITANPPPAGGVGHQPLLTINFSPKTKRLVSLVRDLEIITTATEAEALILEASLIKALFPPYNILLKDDKTMPYIVLNTAHAFAGAYQHRGKKLAGNKYFGPYGGSETVYETIDLMQKLFQIRTCSDSEFKNRTRPCLKYQIKMCSAPCVGKVSELGYNLQIQKVSDFLSGKNNELKNELAKQMNEASQREDFEMAINLRNKIEFLAKIQRKGDINFSDFEDTDTITIAADAQTFAVQVFFIRNGFSFGSKIFFPRTFDDSTEGQVLEAFIAQFYSENDPPREILTNIQLEDTFAANIQQALKCKILNPKLGKKADLVAFTLPNLQNELNKNLSSKTKIMQNLVLLKDFLSLSDIPKRIDVFDNSHNQGTDFIGAMIVAGQDGFIKKEYRKYNVKYSSTKGGDDFAMMYEVMMRRYSKLTDENKPDLIVIDGGKGQMSSVMQAFLELSLSIPFVCVSKGPDRNAGNELFHTPNWQDRPLPKGSPLMFYMQNIRDEAHRFAIGTHRDKRSKTFVKSRLDELAGIGKKRKKQLLEHFGSLENLKKAKTSDICKIDGFSKALAEKVLEGLG